MVKVEFNPSILQDCFTLKAREMCKFCKRYGFKSSCPPNVESVEYYKKLLPSYKNGICYYELFTSSKDWVKTGKESSLVIHNKLLKKRDDLFSQGHTFINAFGAGSCKLCDKCAYPCRHPEKSLIPLEGTGINVVWFMKKAFDIDVEFPIKNELYRIGIILYD